MLPSTSEYWVVEGPEGPSGGVGASGLGSRKEDGTKEEVEVRRENPK